MIRSVLLALIVTLVLPVAASSCGDGSDGDCPNLGGTWKIASHCESDFVNQAVKVTQTDCSFTMDEPFKGFSGVLARDGTITVVGTAGSLALNCIGSATATAVTMDCNSGDCAVTLRR